MIRYINIILCVLIGSASGYLYFTEAEESLSKLVTTSIENVNFPPSSLRYQEEDSTGLERFLLDDKTVSADQADKISQLLKGTIEFGKNRLIIDLATEALNTNTSLDKKDKHSPLWWMVAISSVSRDSAKCSNKERGEEMSEENYKSLLGSISSRLINTPQSEEFSSYWRKKQAAWQQITNCGDKSLEMPRSAINLLDAIETQVRSNERVRSSVLARAEYSGPIQAIQIGLFVFCIFRIIFTKGKTPLVKWGKDALLILGFLGTVWGISSSMGGIVANFGNTGGMADAMGGIGAAFGTTKLGLAGNLIIGFLLVFWQQIIPKK